MFFYFFSKALIALEKIKFYNFKYRSLMTSSNTQAWNKKYLFLNTLGRKHSLLMKFGQFMSYHKTAWKLKFHENWGLKTSSRSFWVCREWNTTFTGKWNFWSRLLLLDMYLQNYQSFSKPDLFLLRILWWLRRAWHWFPGDIFHRVFW